MLLLYPYQNPFAVLYFFHPYPPVKAKQFMPSFRTLPPYDSVFFFFFFSFCRCLFHTPLYDEDVSWETTLEPPRPIGRRFSCLWPPFASPPPHSLACSFKPSMFDRLFFPKSVASEVPPPIF